MIFNLSENSQNSFKTGIVKANNGFDIGSVKNFHGRWCQNGEILHHYCTFDIENQKEEARSFTSWLITWVAKMFEDSSF